MENESWEAHIVFEDHSYTKSPAIDYVVYYVCGYLVKQHSKRYVCEKCLSLMRNTSGTSTKSVAKLTNINPRSFLVYPNCNFFS